MAGYAGIAGFQYSLLGQLLLLHVSAKSNALPVRTYALTWRNIDAEGWSSYTYAWFQYIDSIRIFEYFLFM